MSPRKSEKPISTDKTEEDSVVESDFEHLSDHAESDGISKDSASDMSSSGLETNAEANKESSSVGQSHGAEPGASDVSSGKRAQHARHAATNDTNASESAGASESEREDESAGASGSEREDDRDDSSDANDAESKDTTNGEEDSLGSPDSDNTDEVPEYMRRSRRTRRILIIVIVVLVVLLIAGGFLAYSLLATSQEEADEIVQENKELNTIEEGATEDLSTTTVKTTSPPDLVSLLGLTQDEAIEKLQQGAQVTSTQEVNEENNPIKTESRVVLTDEAANANDSASGIPMVYLGLNEGGSIIQAGYSVATSALGYGSLSFTDAVVNEKIIQKTLAEAGVDIEDSAVSLPSDSAEYSTYADDGTTLTREYCSFSGDTKIDGADHEWSAVLSYDYSIANATGNISDTVRVIYIYISQ